MCRMYLGGKKDIKKRELFHTRVPDNIINNSFINKQRLTGFNLSFYFHFLYIGSDLTSTI